MRHLLRAIPLLAPVLMAAPACNIIGPALYVAHGPDKVKALFELPKERTVVVFVDDRQSYLPRRTLRQIIADQSTHDLLGAKVVEKMIEPRGVLAASTADQPGFPTDIVTLGKSVGADLVIYVTVDGFSLSPDRQSYNPSARVRVKVVDGVNEKGRVWPDDLRGYPLDVIMGERAGAMPDSPATIIAAEDRLGAEVGRRVAELFYSHEPNVGKVDRSQ